MLFKKNNNLQVEVYIDVDWAGSIIDKRSTLRYCTFMGGNLVTSRSKKQSVVARSNAKAEFRAVAHGICELLWLKKLLEDYHWCSYKVVLWQQDSNKHCS